MIPRTVGGSAGLPPELSCRFGGMRLLSRTQPLQDQFQRTEAGEARLEEVRAHEGGQPEPGGTKSVRQEQRNKD